MVSHFDMGQSKTKHNVGINGGAHVGSKVKFDPRAPEPVVSKEQVELLKESWTNIRNDIAKVGIITFVNLFDSHPEVQDVFMSFRSVEKSELEYNAILRAHALRVMGTVDKCISRLDHRDKLRHLMTELGIRHKNYTVKIEFVDLMGPQFIQSIQPHLEPQWTKEHEDAWRQLFELMCYHMKKGMCSI